MSDTVAPQAEASVPIAVPAPTLSELRSARQTLELDIQGAIACLLRSFHDRTGVSVTDVDLRLQKIWPTNQPPRHTVIGVRVALDI
jgi:hypothetical protein